MPFENAYNATYKFPSSYPENMSLPIDSITGNWSQCSRLDANFTREYFDALIPATKVVPCDEWVFDHSKYLSSAVFEVKMIYNSIYLYGCYVTLLMRIENTPLISFNKQVCRIYDQTNISLITSVSLASC